MKKQASWDQYKKTSEQRRARVATLEEIQAEKSQLEVHEWDFGHTANSKAFDLKREMELRCSKQDKFLCSRGTMDIRKTRIGGAQE
jgi:hypothetical protein